MREPIPMKDYDLIIIGSGSAMNIVDPMIQENPNIRIAVIDKDEPGGICLTRGCIPSKILLYPAELVRKIEEARDLGIDTQIKKISFEFVMDRMRPLLRVHGIQGHDYRQKPSVRPGRRA